MDTNSILLVALIALILIGAFTVYRRRVNMRFKIPGVEMKLDAANDPTPTTTTSPHTARSGIFRNWSIGKTRMEVRGSEAIADNRSVGDTELKADATSSQPPTTASRPKRK
jgi:hypothetical protein